MVLNMKRYFSLVFTLLLLSIAFVGPTGCAFRLAEDGIYQGDKFLYGAEKTIVTAYKSFDSFLKWEQDFRAILPIEVTKAADTIRSNAKKWIDTAGNLRDAYTANPTKENRDKLSVGLNLIDTALSEAVKYMAANKSKAPNQGLK